MSRYAIAYLACRLLALYALFVAIGHAGSVLMYLYYFLRSFLQGGATEMGSVFGYMIGTLPIPALEFAFAAWLWFYAPRLVDRLLPGPREDESAVALDSISLEVIGLAIIGAFAVLYALANLSNAIMTLLTMLVIAPAFSLDFGSFTPVPMISTGITGLLQLGFGLYLLFRSPRLVRALHRFRSGSTSRSAPPVQKNPDSRG